MPKFLNVLNMNGNEIQNFAVHNVAAGSAPTTDGSIILDGTALKYYDGSNYVTLGTGAGDITGVTLAGDSGSASDTAGNADLTIAGGNGITTSATSTTVTVTLDAANTTNTSILNTGLTKIGTAADQEYITFATSNEVNTFVNNTERLSVTATGVDITGALTVSGSYNLASGDIPNNAADTSGTATNATNVAVTHGDVTDTTCFIPFVTAGASANYGLKTEGGLAYDATNNNLTTTTFTGALAGNATTATNLGASTSSRVQLGTIEVGHATDTTIARSGAGDITIEGNAVYRAGGTDVAVADGGTGASTLTSNAVLVGNGTSAVTHSSNLSFDDTDVTLAGAGKINFRDTAIHISSGADGHLDLVADTEIQIAATTINMDGAADISGNLTVGGNLTVSGGTTTVTSTTVAIADGMLKLAKDQANNADDIDFGFYGQYGVGGTHKFAGIYRDVNVSGDPFTFFDGLQTEPGTTVDTTATGYDLADIKAGTITAADGFSGTLTGNASGLTASTSNSIGVGEIELGHANDTTIARSGAGVITIQGATVRTGTVAVGNGGTGATTLTDGGILLGSGTGAITAMAVLADGAMIVGDGTTDPVAESGATLRTSIGVSIGSDVQAYDAGLASIAGLTTAADKMIYATDADTYAVTSLTAAGRAILDDANAAAQLVTLGAEPAANKVTKKLSGGAGTEYDISHSFGTPHVMVQLLDYGNNGSSATYDVVHADIKRNDDNSVKITFGSAPGTSQDYLVLITKMPAIS
tara:strand:- start:4233 stop:6506 length:2274 start_codon:yes stop_codon:yes gene_type:complete